MNSLFDVHLIKDDKKKTHKNLYKQRLHVKKKIKKFLNSIKLFLLFSTEMSHMFSTEMS
jgi:hypothetical protein